MTELIMGLRQIKVYARVGLEAERLLKSRQCFIPVADSKQATAFFQQTHRQHTFWRRAAFYHDQGLTRQYLIRWLSRKVIPWVICSLEGLILKFTLGKF